jgi:hypothetical protein
MLIPKTKAIRDKDHLAFIRQLPCCVSLKNSEPCHAAHVRIGANGGMGMKPGDNFVLPLCADVHGRQHAIGESEFWGDMEKPKALAQFLYANTGNRTKCVFEIMKFAREFKRG